MSVNPDGADSVDYSDFEYQQAYFNHRHDGLSGDDASSIVQFETDPLSGIGGLDNNEVAELVYLELQVRIKHFGQDTSDQDVGSETSFDGVFGANLPPTTDLIKGAQAPPDGTIVREDNATAALAGSVYSEDRVFAPFEVGKQPAFDDQTNGPGGAGGAPTIIIERPFRSLVGRGPVLDSSDDVTMVSRLLQEDEIVNATGNVSAHMVWDVAETSDAGRAFSVPMD